MIPYHHHGYDGRLAEQYAAAAANALYTDMDPNSANHPPPPRLVFKMPKVVPNQREKFETDEIFKKNSREAEVRYTLFRDRPLHERQAKFHAGCRDGHIEIANSSTGLVLLLTWNPMHAAAVNRGCYNVSDRIDGVDFNKEPGKVHIRASIIINGVCCRFRGWIDRERLDGIGAIEFDEEMARVEDEILQRQINFYNHRLKNLEDRQRHEDRLQRLKKIH